ncbi:hypothetical protein ABPG74_017760 [Tetrahymena malaccensis]
MLVDAISRSTSQVSNIDILTQAWLCRNKVYISWLLQIVNIQLIGLDYLKIIDKIEIKIYYKMVLEQNQAESNYIFFSVIIYPSRIGQCLTNLNIRLLTHLVS